MRAYFYEALRTLALLMSLGGAAAAHADGGQGTGNGGHFCYRSGSAPVPCDLFFEALDFKLPYAPEREVQWDRLPIATLAEIDRFRSLIFNRTLGTVDLSQILHRGIRLFDTREFLGEDRQYFGPSLEARQAGYAYSFRRRNDRDKALLETVQVIELDMEFLKTVAPRYQAMAILHECMHFLPGLDHAVISPFIQALDALLDVQSSQLRGEKRALKREELEASRDFQGLLTQLGLDGKTYAKMRIHPNGGGVIHYSEKIVEVDDSNFIGVDAAIESLGEGDAYYLYKQSLKGVLTGREAPSRFELGGKISAVLEAETARGPKGRQATGALLTGAVQPFRWCTEFDGQGRCLKRHVLLPVEFALGAGQDTRIQQASISIYERDYRFVGDRAEALCEFRLGKANYEELRMDAGKVVTVNLAAGACDAAIKLVKSGKLKLRIHAALEGGGSPGIFWGMGLLRTPYAPQTESKKGDFGDHLDIKGDAALGIEAWNRLLLTAFAKGTALMGTQGTQDLMMGTYGAQVSLKLPKGFFTQAQYTRETYHFSRQKTEDVPGYSERIHNDVIGVGVGFQRDLVGPYPKGPRN